MQHRAKRFGLNSKLYAAIKASLLQQGISFDCNDITHTFALSDEAKSSVTSLNLNEKGIYDLTGLDQFTSLTHLELSGNNLSKESNLAVLNNLTELNYLDLSTNNLDDVSEISSLISSLKEKGTIVLSGQTVTKVNTVFVDSKEESDKATTADFDLPAILELAGYLKSCWKTEERFSQNVNPVKTNFGTPSINSAPMYVSAENKTIKVNIASEEGSPYYGLVKFTIYIYDDPTEAAQANNPNRASQNILNGSRFYLYYIVHDDSTEAITTMDTNLYKAIKEQLTGGQTVNSELSSYPYSVDINGNIIYEEFTYTTQNIDGIEYQMLKNTKTNEVPYAYNQEYKRIYEYDGSRIGKVVNTIIEPIEIKTTNKNGNISLKAGYRVAHIGEESGETLYVAAYDEAKTFVINDLVLTNKITSLILNNKQIRDLSGIQYFIGLSSDLNVSHNYLSNIDSIYDLEEQKANWEKQIVEQYTNWLKARQYGNLQTSVNAAKAFEEAIKAEQKSLDAVNASIIGILKAAAGLDTSKSEDYQKAITEKANSIMDALKTINGYTDKDGNHVKGIMEKVQDALKDEKENTGLNYEVQKIYNYLETLYSIYNNEYKLTTLLADNVNYQTYDEYEVYSEKIKTSTNSAKELLVEQINYLKQLESAKGLSDLDKTLLNGAFGIDFDSTETETPLAEYFDKFLEKTALNRVQIVSLLEEFREIGIYSEMANYCLIKRMNEDTLDGYCYEEEYLEKRIKEFGYDDIPVLLEENLLNAIKEGKSYSKLFDLYEEYTEKTFLFVFSGYTTYVGACEGEYEHINEIEANTTEYSKEKLKQKALASLADEAKTAADSATTPSTGDTIEAETKIQDVLEKVSGTSIETINLIENIKQLNVSSSDILYNRSSGLDLYNQMMSLSNKLLNGNVERYVTLQRLKKLDISYNADLNNLEKLTTLNSLSNLNASYCYIADVTNVNWQEMTHLRILNLAYNYISDISSLTELPRLKDLNLSNNLISGKLEISEQQYEKLFRKLQNLNLSGNQITDITSLLVYLDYITNGNYANYLAREDTIDISLNNQNITMEVKDPIILADYPSTIDVELPKIFTQLLAIDTERTGFGETSQNGRIESEGTYVTLNTRTPGEKKGVVEVKAMSGNGTVVDNCIGAGTTATIKYKVVDRTVTNVKVNPSEDVKVKLGESLQFTAEVEGEYLNNTNVTWKIEGNTSENTIISEEGLLTIAENEEAEKITVIAVSEADEKVQGTVEVTVTGKVVVTGVTVTPNEDINLKVGENLQFTAKVEGENLDENTKVIWKIEGNTSENTTISEEGLLTVAEDEESKEITVIATSELDETIKSEVKVNIVEETVVEEVKVTVEPKENSKVKVGETLQFTAKVENSENSKVIWKVEGNTSENTTISEEGLLTIAEDEQAENVTVTATSEADENAKTSVVVTVEKNTKPVDPENPDNPEDPKQETVNTSELGYKVSEEYLTQVKPNTPIEEFNKVFLNGKEYNVVVKKDGKEVTSGKMTTGMYVELQDKNGNTVHDQNNDLVVYQVIVKGDINGDGLANAQDSVLIKAHRAEVQTLSEEKFMAADIDGDGKVNVSDSKLLLYHRAEVKGYDLNYSK